jgi:hypothetical protein
MSVQTTSDLSVDLDLVAEEGDNCWCCAPEQTVEATGYIEYADVCPCGFPNPAPLCESHYRMAALYLEMDGPEDWACPVCGHGTEVVGMYRKNR